MVLALSMKANPPTSVRPLQTTQFWLLAIAGGLIAIHLTLTWRLTGDSSRISTTILCWVAVFFLLSEKHHTLRLESGIFSSLLGLLLIGFVLLRNLFLTSIDSFFDFSPFIAGLGLALLASGVKGLPQYWQELMIVFVFNLPVGLLVRTINISPLTAKFATTILSYIGFHPYLQGINILLPKGAVEVESGCSGMESITRMLQLSVLFLVMFPIDLTKKILVPVVAVLIAFVVNSFRVALMAILVAYSNPVAFEYWHKGTGSQIFILISSLVFGVFCYFVSKKDDSDDRDPMEISGS